jgi:hypothetical protein
MGSRFRGSDDGESKGVRQSASVISATCLSVALALEESRNLGAVVVPADFMLDFSARLW